MEAARNVPARRTVDGKRLWSFSGHTGEFVPHSLQLNPQSVGKLASIPPIVHILQDLEDVAAQAGIRDD